MHGIREFLNTGISNFRMHFEPHSALVNHDQDDRSSCFDIEFKGRKNAMAGGGRALFALRNSASSRPLRLEEASIKKLKTSTSETLIFAKQNPRGGDHSWPARFQTNLDMQGSVLSEMTERVRLKSIVRCLSLTAPQKDSHINRRL